MTENCESLGNEETVDPKQNDERFPDESVVGTQTTFIFIVGLVGMTMSVAMTVGFCKKRLAKSDKLVVSINGLYYSMAW